MAKKSKGKVTRHSKEEYRRIKRNAARREKRNLAKGLVVPVVEEIPAIYTSNEYLKDKPRKPKKVLPKLPETGALVEVPGAFKSYPVVLKEVDEPKINRNPLIIKDSSLKLNPPLPPVPTESEYDKTCDQKLIVKVPWYKRLSNWWFNQ